MLQECHVILTLKVYIGHQGRPDEGQVVHPALSPHAPYQEKYHAIAYDVFAVKDDNLLQGQELIPVVEVMTHHDMDHGDQYKRQDDEFDKFDPKGRTSPSCVSKRGHSSPPSSFRVTLVSGRRVRCHMFVGALVVTGWRCCPEVVDDDDDNDVENVCCFLSVVSFTAEACRVV